MACRRAVATSATSTSTLFLRNERLRAAIRSARPTIHDAEEEIGVRMIKLSIKLSGFRSAGLDFMFVDSSSISCSPQYSRALGRFA